MSVWAVILCGGKGSRMGAGMNKTLLRAGNEPVFVKSIRAFKPFCDGIMLVTGENEQQLFAGAARGTGCEPDRFCTGGKERRDSVLNALRALPEDCEYVLIHDGARCFVTGEVISRALDSAKECGSGVAAIPSTDTVKRVDAGEWVLETPERASLRVIQTPQVFRRKDLLKAYEICGDLPATDDAFLMEKAGFRVRLTPGSVENIKLTYPEDLKKVNGCINELPRIGQGYDAHRLTEGRKLILCGVEIPYEKGLLGHSDADVALHALMDAMLGAAALGDIGHLFPDNDEKYRGISSMLLLKAVAERIADAGYRLGNADLTIIAQAPKLAPYIEKMRCNIAGMLETDLENIAVKATTTEKMGFEGRGEGISAMAVVLLCRK